jgi:hypothetical protein
MNLLFIFGTGGFGRQTSEDGGARHPGTSEESADSDGFLGASWRAAKNDSQGAHRGGGKGVTNARWH